LGVTRRILVKAQAGEPIYHRRVGTPLVRKCGLFCRFWFQTLA
jgi:hypothetical protein